MTDAPGRPSDSRPRLLGLVSDLLPGGRVANLSDGVAREGTGERVLLVNPADGRPLLDYAEAGAEAVEAAMAGAARAQRFWWGRSAAERGRALLAVSRLLRERAEGLAELEVLNAGKPLRDARAEAGRVAEMFEYYAGWCDKLHGEVVPVPGGQLVYTRPEPHGVAVQVTPWNAPLFTAGWQVAPALCAGNAAVLKPSELTPLSSLALGRICAEAGLPEGLVSVLAGAGPTTGAALTGHPGAGIVVLVGSPEAGAAAGAAAARNLVPCLLELGGKSANIVFADADLDAALLGAQAAAFGAAGQSCVAGSRLLLQRSIAGPFLERLARAVPLIPQGDPRDPETRIGPLQNARHLGRVRALLDGALSRGARLAAGGGCPERLRATGGHYLAPTVVEGADPSDPIAREEVFGPVLTVLTFGEEAEAVALADDTAYGLAGAVWTRDPARAHRVAGSLRAGTVWINGYRTIHVSVPFGGFGRSGHGRSSGREALAAYARSRAVWVETAEGAAASPGVLPGVSSR